jgi:hypothetical protein
MRFFTLNSWHYKRNLNALSIKALKLFLLNVFQSNMKMGMLLHIRILFKGALPFTQLSIEGGRGSQGNHLASPIPNRKALRSLAVSSQGTQKSRTCQERKTC